MLSMLLHDEESAALIGVRAMEVFDSQAGATARAASAILRLLGEKSGTENTEVDRSPGRSSGSSAATREPDSQPKGAR
jgi:hypothetical protein